jgi:hypothetical protein
VLSSLGLYRNIHNHDELRIKVFLISCELWVYGNEELMNNIIEKLLLLLEPDISSQVPQSSIPPEVTGFKVFPGLTGSLL